MLRFAEGAAAAAFLPSARALITDTVPSKQRGEAFGIFSAFLNAGFLLGPGLGGLLAATGYATAFIGAVIFRLVAIVIVVTMIHVKARGEQEIEEAARPVSLRTLFKIGLTGAYILAFGNYIFVGFDITLTALWLHDHLGASVAVIGFAYVAFSIPGIIVAPFGGRVADRRRRSITNSNFWPGTGSNLLYLWVSKYAADCCCVLHYSWSGLFDDGTCC